MSAPAPELGRPVPVDRVGAGLVITVDATPAECAAIAQRLQVPSIEALQCRWSLRPAPGGIVEGEGSLRAALHQECVVSLDAFAVDLIEEFAVRFVPAGKESETQDDPDDPDELPLEHDVLQLGEATVEQLALALPPYPRKPGAELPEDAGEASANPFGTLAKWRAPE